MARELNLFVDTERGACVSGFTSTIPATIPSFKFGDTIPVNVRPLVPDATNPPYKEYDLTDKTIRLGIGVPAGTPSSGSWFVTYGANTTAALAFNISAADLQTALNALASITSAGGVTVTKGDGLNYRAVFNTAGARTDFSSDTALLYPSTAAYIGVAMQGSVSAKEVVLFSLETQPAAYVELSDPLPSANIGITVVRAGGVGIGEIQTIDLSSPEPFGGSYALEIDGNATPAITYNATPEEVQAAIQAASEDYADLLTVNGTFPLYTVSFDASLAAIGAMVPDESALVVPTGRTGSLSLNTAGVIELLNGDTSKSAKLEIEIYDTSDSTSFTPGQQDITVVQDVIPNSPASQTPLPEYPTTTAVEAMIDASAVRYDETQSLEIEEKERARENIGAASARPTTESIIANGDITPSDSGALLLCNSESDITLTVQPSGSWSGGEDGTDIVTIVNLSDVADLVIEKGSGVTFYGKDLVAGIRTLGPLESAQVMSLGFNNFFILG